MTFFGLTLLLGTLPPIVGLLLDQYLEWCDWVYDPSPEPELY